MCGAPDNQLGDATTIHYYAESFGALLPATSGGLPAMNATYWCSYVLGDRARMARACKRTVVIQEVRVMDHSAVFMVHTLCTHHRLAPTLLFKPTAMRSSSATLTLRCTTASRALCGGRYEQSHG